MYRVIAGDIVATVVGCGEAEDVEDLKEILVEEAVLVELEGHTTLSHVTSTGCMVIWHVTAPIRHLSHEVEAVAPLLEAQQDLGIEAQGIVEGEVDGRSYHDSIRAHVPISPRARTSARLTVWE